MMWWNNHTMQWWHNDMMTQWQCNDDTMIQWHDDMMTGCFTDWLYGMVCFEKLQESHDIVSVQCTAIFRLFVFYYTGCYSN